MTPTISQEDYAAAERVICLTEERRGLVAEVFALHRQQAEQKLAEHLADPAVVHVNMLRGSIAKLSADQIWHIYQRQLLDEMPENFRDEIRQQARLAALEEAAGVAEKTHAPFTATAIRSLAKEGE